MKNRPWLNCCHCPSCGAFGEQCKFHSFYTRSKLCKACGYHGTGWIDMRVRWASEATWYKPWTWLRGDWEIHEEDEKAYVTIYKLRHNIKEE